MNDKDKLISFINKGKENNPIKEVHVIKDNDAEAHILLVNEDGTSIASNKFEVGGASGGEVKTVSINDADMTWDTSQVDITKDRVIYIEQINGPAYLFIEDETHYYYYNYNCNFESYPSIDMSALVLNSNGTIENKYLSFSEADNVLIFNDGENLDKRILCCPDLPSDASTKTYTLKAINGTLTWAQ